MIARRFQQSNLEGAGTKGRIKLIIHGVRRRGGQERARGNKFRRYIKGERSRKQADTERRMSYRNPREGARRETRHNPVSNLAKNKRQKKGK